MQRYWILPVFFVVGAAAAGCPPASEGDVVAPPAAPAPAAAARAAPKVSDTEVVVGMNAVFSGPSTGLGVEMWRGASAAFEEINAKGGVHGRRITLRLSDDRYEADAAAPAIVKLIEQDNVFNTGWSVGTPTIVKALPVILKYHRSESLFHFGNFTGAQPQRTPPFAEAVFNVRASYRQETAAMVDAYVASGRKRIGVFVQDDAYGTDGRDGVVRALAVHGLELVADTRYPRGQQYAVSNQAQLDLLRGQNADAVIMVGSYQACAGFIRDARLAKWSVPIHNVSFVGADQLLEYLRKEEATSKTQLIANLINTQVIPHYDDTSLSAVRDYRAAIDRFDPKLPPEAQASGYVVDKKYTFGSLEGYVTARAYLTILERAGRDLSRQAFIATAESMGDFDLGLAVPASFSKERHQALDKVWFTHATAAGWKPVSDVTQVLR